jgi:hypothetical protein
VSANQKPDEGPISFSGPRAGVLLGYEQPIHAKASIVADWFSGKNALGYFTPGISITLPGSGLLNVGYSLGTTVGKVPTPRRIARSLLITASLSSYNPTSG